MTHQENRLKITGAVALAVGVVMVVLSGGCTMGPDPERPVTAADASETYVYADQQEVAAVSDSSTEWPANTLWWKRFGDPTTAELVEMALEANPDLHVAAARVLEAEALLDAAGGARLPQIG